MGALYKRYEGGCYYFSYDGCKIRTPYKDKDAAEKWRRNYIADAGMARRRVGAENATVSDLLALVERDYERTGKASGAALASRLTRLRDYFGKLKITDLRDDHIEGYTDERLAMGRELKSGERKPVKAATVNRELEVLRRAFMLGSRKTPPLVTTVPRIAMLDESDNVRTQIIDRATYERLIEALPDAERRLTVLAWHIGWRFERLRTLTWAQVDFERGVILAPDRQRAGKMVGTAPIYGGMQEVLLEAWRSAEEIGGGPQGLGSVGLSPGPQGGESRSPVPSPEQDRVGGMDSLGPPQWANRREGMAAVRGSAPTAEGARPRFVIRRPNGSPVVDIRKAWTRCTRAAGCEGFHFHSLRACAASNLIDAGVPQIEAQKILGHKTASMFVRYHICSTDRLAEIGRMVEARTEETKEDRRVN
jgi:integrase